MLMTVALLGWETASPSGLTLDRKRDNGSAFGAAASAEADTAPALQLSEHDEVHRALAASGIFSRTSPEVVTELSRQLKPARFPPGQTLETQSSFGRYVYVIVSGKVKAFYQRPDGRGIVLKLLGPSEILGTDSLFDAGPQEMSMITLTDVVAVPIDRDRLLQWMVEQPEVCDQVLRLFARRLKAMTDSLFDLAFADAQSRVASRLLLLKKQFGQQDGDVVRVVHDLTADDLSDLAGVDPETICATLRGFEANGWIRLDDGSIVIVDGHALSQVRQVSMGEVCGV